MGENIKAFVEAHFVELLLLFVFVLLLAVTLAVWRCGDMEESKFFAGMAAGVLSAMLAVLKVRQ